MLKRAREMKPKTTNLRRIESPALRTDEIKFRGHQKGISSIFSCVSLDYHSQADFILAGRVHHIWFLRPGIPQRYGRFRFKIRSLRSRGTIPGKPQILIRWYKAQTSIILRKSNC